MDTGKVFLLGGAAVGIAWWQGWLAPLGIAAPGGTAAAAPSPASTGTPPAAPAGPSLDVLFAQMTAAASGDSTIVNGLVGPDTWNFYLMKVYPAMGAAPDPGTLFGSRNPISATAYWAVMAPWLKQNKGLSGMGPHGLGCVCNAAWRENRW